MNRICVFPGSFDPVTYGHLNIIERAARLCEKLVIGVLANNQKTPLFSVDERVKMIQEVVSGLENVEVKSFDGLLVDFVRQEHADCVVRGLRNGSDFDYEMTMSWVNQLMMPEYETIFLVTDKQYCCISSSAVRSGVPYGADIHNFVPPLVEQKIREKYKETYHEQH